MTILAMTVASWLCAQQAEITNGFDGFETWITAEAGELPQYWDGFNKNIEFNGIPVGTVACIEKSNTDPYEGLFSAKLTSTSIMGGPAVPAILTVGDFVVDWVAQDGDVEGGEAYTQRPTELSGQFKYTPMGVDTGFVALWFLQNGIEVGRGRFEFTETTGGWTSFSVIIDYDAGAAPDSMNLMFSSSQSDASSIPDGTILEIDAIEFGSYLSVNSLESNQVRCYPNPASDYVKVAFKEAVSGQAALVDMNGATVLSKAVQGDALELDVAALPTGTYRLLVETENNLLSKTIVVE